MEWHRAERTGREKESTLLHRRVQEGNELSLDPHSPHNMNASPLPGMHAVAFPSFQIPSMSVVTLTVQTNVPFWITRFIVPSDIALHFEIRNIFVGKNSIMESLHPLPAVLFAENAFGFKFPQVRCHVSMQVTVVVQNNHTAPVTFRGVFTGHIDEADIAYNTITGVYFDRHANEENRHQSLMDIMYQP